MSPKRRAVFTGIGVLSSVGCDPAAFRASVMEGRAGVGPLTSLDTSELPVKIGGEIPEFNPRKMLDKEQRKSLRVMARPVQLGFVAAKLAMENSGTGKGQLDPDRFGVEFGAGLIASELDDLTPAAKASLNCKPNTVSLAQWGEVGMKEVPPLWMLKYLPNMPACHVSIMHDARGPSNSITASDAASLLALGEAFRILTRDVADFMLVGGTESKLNPLSLIRNSMFGPLSPETEPADAVLRPFDARRTGTVLGEGAGALTLEDLDHAKKRGATIHAELVGFAGGFDRPKKGEILAGVIKRAMREAGITPDDVDHVNAHGIGSGPADAWEANAIRLVFGDETPVYAGKAITGHTGAAGGLIELLTTIQSFGDGRLPGTINHTERGDDCPIAVHTGDPRPVTKDYAVKIGFTDLGQCAAVVVKRWKE